ncbi:MAG TPA: lysyl oxidase family protein [Candidatus Acidoferrum sp.]|nr:lysyl oxidase family protein [Candidatus Acidoferrum sp.]
MISDAWWTYQQDCNGDGCWAGTLANDRARLNWNPDVTNCNGTLTVYEIVYDQPCGSGSWTAIHTNAPHPIVGCRSSDSQSVDIPLGAGCSCRNYKIEVYRSGQTQPDDVRSSTNDADLLQHREQLLAEDYCLSDFFATCAAISGTVGSHADNNSDATKEPGEPDHAGNPGGKSLWYCWTAPTNAPVTFDTLGSSFDTLLAVYTGDSVSNLTLVADNDDIDGATNRQSRVTFTPLSGTTYHIAVDGYGGACGIVVLNWNQSGTALPDLIIWGPAASPTVITRTFTNGDCEVVEGCETPGTHTLLSFTTETRNIGDGDLALGNPGTNSLFQWASCHGHYHFEEFADYELLDGNGNVVASGHKVGFCLLDDHPWSPTASPQVKYDCWNQGIQSGWADVYAAGLPCQYIDITGVPPGDYALKMVVNPYGLLAESDTNNNATLVPVTIPPASCLIGPVNDNFINAMIITNTPFSFSEFNACATKEIGEPNHAGNAGGHSIWFTWTPATNQTAVITTKGSDFDTLLAVYTGNNLLALTPVASNDDIIPEVYLQSEVTFFAAAGTSYRIAMDGYNGAVGTVVLNLQPPGNDDFVAAAVLVGTAGTTNGTTIGASKEPGEMAHAGDVGGHSVWYRWTAPASGPVDFNTLGSTFNTTLAVYLGNVLTNLATVAANNDDVGGLMSSRVDFFATGGTTYQIAVAGFGGDTGNVQLNWNMDCRLAITNLPNGTVQLTLRGVDWQRYTLESSTDLLNWITNTPTISLPGDSYIYTNRRTGDRQFYRVRPSL